jgi:hypothetical protein
MSYMEKRYGELMREVQEEMRSPLASLAPIDTTKSEMNPRWFQAWYMGLPEIRKRNVVLWQLPYHECTMSKYLPDNWHRKHRPDPAKERQRAKSRRRP